MKVNKGNEKSALFYKCPYCPHTSRFSSNMKRHKLTHIQERPFVCHICKISFKQENMLQVHLINIHGS